MAGIDTLFLVWAAITLVAAFVCVMRLYTAFDEWRATRRFSRRQRAERDLADRLAWDKYRTGLECVASFSLQNFLSTVFCYTREESNEAGPAADSWAWWELQQAFLALYNRTFASRFDDSVAGLLEVMEIGIYQATSLAAGLKELSKQELVTACQRALETSHQGRHAIPFDSYEQSMKLLTQRLERLRAAADSVPRRR